MTIPRVPYSDPKQKRVVTVIEAGRGGGGGGGGGVGGGGHLPY